jgi:hypothetical protein
VILQSEKQTDGKPNAYMHQSDNLTTHAWLRIYHPKGTMRQGTALHGQIFFGPQCKKQMATTTARNDKKMNYNNT